METTPRHSSIGEVALTTTMEQVVEPPPTLIRRSNRLAKPTAWLHEFVDKHISQPTSCQYPMSNFMSYNSLSNSYHQVLCDITTIRELESYEEAMQDPK